MNFVPISIVQVIPSGQYHQVISHPQSLEWVEVMAELEVEGVGTAEDPSLLPLRIPFRTSISELVGLTRRLARVAGG